MIRIIGYMAGFPSLFQSKSSYCQTLSVFQLSHHHCSRLILLPAAASPALSILFRILSFRFSACWTKVLWVKLSARLFAGRLAWSAFTASASQQGLRAPTPLVGTVRMDLWDGEAWNQNLGWDTGKVLPGDRRLAEYGRAATQLQARERTESQDAPRILPPQVLFLATNPRLKWKIWAVCGWLFDLNLKVCFFPPYCP